MSFGPAEDDKVEDTLSALTERSRLFDQVLASIPDFVYTFDREGRFTFINKPLLDLWGMSLSDALGKTFFELPYSDDLARKLHEQILSVVETGERVVDETPYESPSGAKGFYQYIFSPVRSADGDVEAVAGSTRDITQIRNLEQARNQAALDLAVERTNLAEVVERAPSFICFLQGPDHVFQFANDRYLELVGRRDIVGKPLLEALPELAGQGFSEMLKGVLASGQPILGDEVPVNLTSGRRVVNFVYQPIKDSDGSTSGVFVHGVDVTDLVNSRRALEESRQLVERQARLYEAILSNTPDLAYVFDLDHRFAYANETLLQMWGKTNEEAIGKTCLELGYEPWHAEMHDREIEHVKATKESVRGEVPFTGTFGRRIYDYILVPVIGADGKVEAVAGTTRDITDRVVMEEQVTEQSRQIESESKRKDEFLAMLSHELRNPLAPISSAVTLLNMTRRPDETENERKAKEIIERQVNNLTKIVGDLLEVSRVVTGRIRLEQQTADLREVLQHAIETTKPLVDQRRHMLTLEIEPEPLWMSVDIIRMEEVFVNLINNAAKYTAPGGKIEIFCLRTDAESTTVRIRDNGIGIDAELLPVIFELFTQGDRSLDRAAGGLGIGLNLVQRLVTKHGGSIVAHSPAPNTDMGTEFIMRLPLSAPPCRAEDSTSDSHELASSGGRKLLVVDDNIDMVSMSTTYLQHHGYDVRNAFNGMDALDLAAEWSPEIIVLDIGLPGIDGYEVARRLRSDQKTSGAKIIAITGYGRESDIAKAMEAGFDAHLTKPYRMSELEALLNA